MKNALIWAAGLLTAAALMGWQGYALRNFGMLLMALALAFGAMAAVVKWLRTPMVTVITLVLALALMEFALSFIQRSGTDQAAHFDSNTDYVKHYWSQTDIGAIPRTGRHSTRKVSDSGEVVYAAHYTIGDDGFRVTPAPLSTAVEAALNKKRVNVLGCSVAFGEGVNDDQTFAHYAQQSLPGVTVKNFGIHGYGMHQALAILESQRDTKGQANFVLTAPWHAERSACVPSFALGSPRYRLLADGSVERDGVCGSIPYYSLSRVLSLSKTYSLVKAVIERQAGQDPQIALYLGLIKGIHAVSQSRQQAVLVGMIRAPDAWYTGTYSNDKIIAAIRAMGIEVVDITLADKAENVDPRYTLHKLDQHPTALGHEARAKLVEEPLKKLLVSR